MKLNNTITLKRLKRFTENINVQTYQISSSILWILLVVFCIWSLTSEKSKISFFLGCFLLYIWCKQFEYHHPQIKYAANLKPRLIVWKRWETCGTITQKKWLVKSISTILQWFTATAFSPDMVFLHGFVTLSV